MLKINKVNNNKWEIEASKSDEVRKAGIQICDLARTDSVGIPALNDLKYEIDFTIIFNGLVIEFITRRELYMFGFGLQVAIDALPINLTTLNQKSNKPN
jgi:hypothetical protein